MTALPTTPTNAHPLGRIRIGLGVGGSILFGLLIGSLLLAILCTQVLGYRVLTIQSFSMEPSLRRGDIIVTKPVSIGSIQQGDVILFEEGATTRELVAHRVVAEISVTTNVTDSRTGGVSSSNSKVLRTKGDANTDVDAQTVDASNFKGEVMFSIPKVGLIMNRIPLQHAFIAAFGLTAAAWGAYELRRYRRRAEAAQPAAR